MGREGGLGMGCENWLREQCFTPIELGAESAPQHPTNLQMKIRAISKEEEDINDGEIITHGQL